MKNILLIGVGGTGSKAVDIFFQKYNELGNQTGNNITALVFDTDAGDLKKISAAKTVAMADTASVGTICDRFGKEFLKEWFPCDDKSIRAQEMVRGASQWRKKSYLAFLNLMNKPLARATFIEALEKMVADPGASCEIYVIASVAGGTGSGSFIPIALYAKRYLRKNLGKDPIVNAMIALPDIYADSQTPENRIKVYSNAYAILRELNAINLVARNYNAGRAAQKKAPIRFRIGHPDEPSVGVLFDASDKQFWTPEAAPFSQVFLLDRIPGLNSVTAHDIVLANSLYTILCTEIGSAFDSEFSNHELLRSQNNGSNAIYAGISTSQIRFPQESILDYLAHKKTLSACDNEWLALHQAVEATIKEKEQQAKACNRRYVMADGEYADIVLSELEKGEENGNEEMLALVERCLEGVDKNGEKLRRNVPVENFVKSLDLFIGSKIPAFNEEEVTSKVSTTGKVSKDTFLNAFPGVVSELEDYFVSCATEVKRNATSTADAILTLDRKKESFFGKQYSLIENLLKKNGKYIHPVAIMIQLCQFRSLLTARLKAGTVEWEALKKRDMAEAELPEDVLEITTAGRRAKGSASKSGAYAAYGTERFAKLMEDAGKSNYKSSKTKTNPVKDCEQLKLDGCAILVNISEEAKKQLAHRVYTRLAEEVDLLIEKFRNFFNRFEKEKEDLVEQTKTAHRKDSQDVDSVINVYSSMKDKDRILKDIFSEAGPATDAEIARTDDIVGSGVFSTVYNSAASAYAQDNSWNDKDSGAYRSLFGNMVKAYRESICKSDAYEKLASYNVIEAIIASCGLQADEKMIDDAFRSRFSVAQELAIPSLRLDSGEQVNDLVQPSSIMVFMMSVGTGKYIKKHADEFHLRLPADQTKESEVIKSCAEEFIRRYSGNNSARVSIVSSLSDQVLYCTGEIMDITPLRIAKFNELGDDNLYFKNYTQAIANYKKFGTDMWNPHLGNDFHKRGYLPYMNEEKEKECDEQMVKALLYAFQTKHIVYNDGTGETQQGRYYFVRDGKKITDPEGKWINNKNIAQLLAWMRNEDDLIEKWSTLFDREIQRQMNSLPNLASDNTTEISALEKALTNLPFMQMLTDSLYADPSDKKNKGSKKVKYDNKSAKLVVTERTGPTAIEFAYMIKTSEEIGRDCDDAERILSVLYKTFKSLCAFRTSPENNPERFIQVYKQQLGNVYEALAVAKVVCASGSECVPHFNQLVTWLNQADVFNTISEDLPMDETGKVCIDVAFDYTKSSANDVKKYLEFVKKVFGRKGSADEAEADELDETAEMDAVIDEN